MTRMKVVRVRLLKKGERGTYAAGNHDLKKGDFVLVPTPSGPQVAEVLAPPFDLDLSGKSAPLIIGRAEKKDLRKLEQVKKRETAAFRTCQGLIEKLGLQMKLVDVEFQPQERKITFYFTAEGRVDFRLLVRKLASRLKARIEMRQIGVRDEAKLRGGIGPCGREVCCSTFLKDFDTVTIRMAKEQNLPLNPERISGLCGRLMCCITFEMDTYQQMGEELPKVGKRVHTKYGEGKVIRQNVLLKTLTVELSDGTIVTIPWKEVRGAEEER